MERSGTLSEPSDNSSDTPYKKETNPFGSASQLFEKKYCLIDNASKDIGKEDSYSEFGPEPVKSRLELHPYS